MMWDHVNEICYVCGFLIYYICRVAHGHRQVGRLALRTSDTCYIYILIMWDHVNEICYVCCFLILYYICRVAHGHRQVGRLALRTSDTCYIYIYIYCTYILIMWDHVNEICYVCLHYLLSYIYYICRVAHGHRQVGRLALRTSDTCYIYIYIHILIMWDHVNEICYVCGFLI